MKMVECSVVSTGNNYRMKKYIEKARKGLQITIAYLGGSITEGYSSGFNSCYAKLTYDYFSQNFGTGSNVKYINAGMAGTSSTIELLLIECNVLQYKPDIIFVEFAVNGSKDYTSLTAFESLLIRLLNYDTQPAVVLLFTVTKAGYSCQNEMEQIGKHYDLPMISVKDAITPEMAAGRMTWQDYSNDYIHPDKNGHKLVTEFIKYYLEKVDKIDLDSIYQLSNSTVYGNEFTYLKMLDSTNAALSTLGGFVPDNTINRFPKGWSYKAGLSKGRFTLDIDCRNIFLIYKESSTKTVGTVDIYVDDTLKLSVNGYNSSGWNNPVEKLIFNEGTTRKHKIEIKMSKGSEDREFSILAFGYSE
jgi:acyl-CoA thioesterase I